MCQFSKLSNLWGCGAVAVNLETNQTYTCSTSASSPYGKIENVIDGNYQVKCYGVDSNNNTITYDSPSHTTSMIEVTPSSNTNLVTSTSCSNSPSPAANTSKDCHCM